MIFSRKEIEWFKGGKIHYNCEVGVSVVRITHITGLTFPVFTILWTEEIVTHFSASYTFNNMTCLQWVNDKSVKFLFPSVHFHITFFRKKLPRPLTNPKTGIMHLLLRYSFNLKNNNNYYYYTVS